VFLSVFLFDIEHFKKVDDTYGHNVGDTVLREVAQRLIKLIRRSDLFVRYGGEEFLLLLSGANESKAMEIAERLHASVSEQPFSEVGVL
jgi:two-component system, cell cycle response regulator